MHASKFRHTGEALRGELDLAAVRSLFEIGAAFHESDAELDRPVAQQVVEFRPRDVVGIVRHPLDRFLREKEIEPAAIAGNESDAGLEL